MNIDKIKELVKILNNSDYKDVFSALVIFEYMDYLQDLNDFSNMDIEVMEEVYEEFMNNSNATGLLNSEIKEILERPME